MKQSKFRETAVIVADRIRSNEIVDVSDAIIEAHGDLAHYIEQAALSALAKDQAGFQKSWRDAQMTQSATHLTLPGMDHASLPALVFDAEGNAIPVALATLSQVKREVARYRRSVSVRDRVVAGYEATIARLEELGIDGDMTGAEIATTFPTELEA